MSIVIESHNGIEVLRDDFLSGGTKSVLLKNILDTSYDEFVYPSPVYGAAQIALSSYCKSIGKEATIFCAKRKKLHPNTQRCLDLGAKVVEIPYGYLHVVQYHAKNYCEENGAHLIPFGGDHPIIIEAMCRAALSLESIKRFVHPKEVWTVMSSGVLSRGLQKAWPNAKVYGVQIGHNTTEDEMGRAETFRSKYKFQQECKKDELPPFPSSLTYDSKAWTFINEHATKGALFWNVGK